MFCGCFMGFLRIGLSCFTLTFDSSPIKGEGILSVGLSCLHPAPLDCGSSPQ